MTSLIAAVAGILAAAGILDLAAAHAARPRRTSRRRRPAWRSLIARLGRRVGAPRGGATLAARLEAAGAPLAFEELLALKAGAATAAGLAVLPLAAAAPGNLGLVTPAAAAAGAFAAPDLWLRRRIRSRAAVMQAELPDVVDLLRVALEAGLPIRRAVAEVGRRHHGLLAAELRHAAALLSLGTLRRAALEALRRRVPAAGAAALIATLERAERTGAPPAEALAALAREARADAARERAEAAARAAPQIQLVVALLLVPSVLLLVAAALVPALLR
jgi:tight adherence protein C